MDFDRAGKWPKSPPKFKIPCLWPGVTELLFYFTHAHKSQPWKWPFSRANSTRKMTIFYLEKSQAWKMVIFGVGFQISNFCFEKNSTRKMTIFHPERSQAWKKSIFRVEVFFQKFFHRAGKWPKSPPKFKILCLWPGVAEKSQGWKKSPPENGHFPCMGFKDFFLC